MEDVEAEGRNALVGFFVNKRPHYLAVKSSLTKAWRSTEEVEFHALENGFFMFKFHTYQESQRILEEGPWFVYGHPIVIKRWSDDMNLLFIGLIETKIRSSYIPHVRNNIFPTGRRDHTNIILHCNTVRIWVGWGPKIAVTILHDSAQHIHCKLMYLNESLPVTICYGENSHEARKQL